MAALLTLGVLWARGKAQVQRCRQVQVVVANDSITFVTEQGILDVLEHGHIALVGLPMSSIDTRKVEQYLSQLSYLENVDCVKNGTTFLIKVEQILPVMRVMDGNDSYYVNAQGKRMQAQARFFSDVPIVRGHFTAPHGPEMLLPMISYAQSDSTLKNLVGMWDYHDPENIFMIPNITGQVVNMGNAKGFENKFKKLLLFYRKVLPVKGWETYDTISLKWDHQVVATLRTKPVKETVEINPEEDEPMADVETMSTGPVSQEPAPKPKQDGATATGKQGAGATEQQNKQDAAPKAQPSTNDKNKKK